MNKALAIAGLAVVVITGLTIWLYGNARYDAGEASCLAGTNATAAEASKQSAKDLEKEHHETLKMSPDAVDTDLVRLGIMRSDADR